MNLSDKEAIILHAAEHQPLRTLEELQELTGFESHVVRYQLKRLEKKGVISNARPFVNVYPLGYTEYIFYFALNSARHSVKQALIEKVTSFPIVSWLGELGGDYHFALALSVRHVGELTQFLEQLTDMFGNIFRDKALVSRPRYVHLGRNYLRPDAKPGPVLGFGGVPEDIKIDDTDKMLLKHLVLGDYRSFHELSKISGIPFTTLERRRKNLEKLGVIVGYYYQVSASMYGMYAHKIFVSVAGMSSTIKERMFEFAKKQPNIVVYAETIGNWDFEFALEVFDYAKIIEICDSLYDEFGREINNVFSLPLFRYHKRQNFPFINVTDGQMAA
ncbi:MAG: Lrp/AsnC family transcriptional regulator [Bdellovibrionales bacterium]|nr:Lrp/AsnC family transcriptional regulator [Bdellovibrionales bacterium]